MLLRGDGWLNFSSDALSWFLTQAANPKHLTIGG